MIEGTCESNVTAWLADHVPALMPPVSYSLIAGGNSNLTYRCEDAHGNVYVLRRPPLGQVLQSAHDMSREHRIIDALKDSSVPVPQSYGLCQDPAVNEADFCVMGNTITADGEVKAVLDWELCTLGDPLADVGYLLNNWISADEVLESGDDYHAPTAAGGFISRQELTEYYATTTGRDLSGINYYRAFSHWRLASIAQGAYKRYLAGAMGENRDADVDEIKLIVSQRARAALELLQS